MVSTEGVSSPGQDWEEARCKAALARLEGLQEKVGKAHAGPRYRRLTLPAAGRRPLLRLPRVAASGHAWYGSRGPLLGIQKGRRGLPGRY